MSLLDVLLDWINWFHFLFLEGDQHVALIDCMIFLSPFLEVTRMSISSFFPCTARLWNSLPIKCFPLAYNVNGLKSRIKSFNCRFFLKRLPVCVNLFVLLFLAIPYRIVAVQPCMEWIPIKKKLNLLRLLSTASKCAPVISTTSWRILGCETVYWTIIALLQVVCTVKPDYVMPYDSKIALSNWTCYCCYLKIFVWSLE